MDRKYKIDGTWNKAKDWKQNKLDRTWTTKVVTWNKTKQLEQKQNKTKQNRSWKKTEQK